MWKKKKDISQRSAMLLWFATAYEILKAFHIRVFLLLLFFFIAW